MTDPNTPAPKGEHDGDEPVTAQSEAVPNHQTETGQTTEHDAPLEPAVAPEDRVPAPEVHDTGAQDPAAAADSAAATPAEPAGAEPAGAEPGSEHSAVAAQSEPAEPAVAPEDRPVPPLSEPTSQVSTGAPATGVLHDDSALRAAEAARSDEPSDPSPSAPVAPGSAPAPESDDLGDTRLTAAGAGAGAGAAATSSTAAWTPPPAPASPSEYAAPTSVITPTPYAPPTQAMPAQTSTTPISNLGTSPAESLGFTDGIAGDNGFSPEEIAQRRQFRDELAFQQKQEFGGINFGAGFFGWLAAVGLAGLLYVIVGGIAGVSGFAQPSLLTGEQATVKSFGSELSAQTLQITALVIVLVVLFLSYFVGGFVAGRMARFSGVKQGLAVWLWGVFMTVIAAVVLIVVASQSTTVSTLQDQMDPVTLQTFTSVEALIAEGLIVVLSIGGALLGGLAGMRFHKKVDRFAVEEA